MTTPRDKDHWARVHEILTDALGVPAPDRPALLDARCADDGDLRAEVEHLLANADTDGILDRSPIDALFPTDASDGGGREDSGPSDAAQADDRVDPNAGNAPDLPTALPPGSEIGPYRIHELLGEGGMGSVYRAEQTEPVRREVALKVIKPGMDTREVVTRFQSERQSLAVMDHSGIARVLDAGATERGLPYFVMELVRGVPITEYCDTHRLPTRDRIRLFEEVCDAVQHAHQKGVIHRDLKPSNVLVTIQDSRPVPKIIDFGIAKAVGTPGLGDGLITTIGQILGTPAYMSPEQAEQSGLDVDTRTDVYSLGVMLYELLAGSLPFDKEAFRKPDFLLGYVLRQREVPTPSARLGALADTQETVAKNRTTDVRTLRRELRGDLDWIVMRAMEKDRTRRYGTAAELATDLRRYRVAEPVTARPPTVGYRLRKFATRNRGPIAAGVALGVAMVVGTVASVTGFVRAERAAEAAQASAARAEAVSAFLDQALRAADPVRGAGSETTVRELLDAASEEVETGSLSEQPLVEVGVRRSIGGTYMHLGLHDEAAGHFEAALALVDEAPGASVDERVTLLDELGQLRRRQGLHAEAEGYLRDALRLAESSGLAVDGGAGESLTNRVRNDLGLLLRDRDQIEEAITILESLAESERQLLAPDDVALASTLNNLALVKRASGDIDGAILLFDETLGVLRAAFGSSHVYVASVLESVGSLEQRMGRYPTADSLMQEALIMRRELLGQAHPDIQNGLANLGLLYLEMGDMEGAESYLSESLEMSVELNGSEHPRTGTVLHSMGLLHLRAGRADRAEEAFRDAIAIRVASLGPDHRNTLNARSNLAAAILLGGDAARAEEGVAGAVEGMRAQEMHDAVLYGSALRTWGRALTELERFGEAESVLLEAYELQAEALGSEHRRAQATAESLRDVYSAWGRNDDAELWAERTDLGPS